MSAYDYDLFVIGAGSGGVRAARVAAEYGARVAIAEEDRVGGTCVIRGCVPKKLFVHAAHFAEAFEDAVGFGWTVESVRFDWPTLRDNVAADVEWLSRHLYPQPREVRRRTDPLARGHRGRRTASGWSAKTGRSPPATILIATGGQPSDRPLASRGSSTSSPPTRSSTSSDCRSAS